MLSCVLNSALSPSVDDAVMIDCISVLGLRELVSMKYSGLLLVTISYDWSSCESPSMLNTFIDFGFGSGVLKIKKDSIAWVCVWGFALLSPSGVSFHTFLNCRLFNAFVEVCQWCTMLGFYFAYSFWSFWGCPLLLFSVLGCYLN